ncbi:MAG: hypothetical protein Q9214_002412, partial [Letrouitia sp. 1 TL-2023]
SFEGYRRLKKYCHDTEDFSAKKSMGELRTQRGDALSHDKIGICIGSCVVLLAIYCGTQARAHTSSMSASGSGGPSPGAQTSKYNSSASAVSAIWLFSNIYVASSLRASRPQLQFPVIMYSIFVNVALTYAPQFATMIQGIAFTKRLLEAFLTGFGIATGVSFFIFPITSRKVVFKQVGTYISALKTALQAQSAYLESLEIADIFGSLVEPNVQLREEGKDDVIGSGSRVKLEKGPEATALKSCIHSLGELHGKIMGDVPFAKREIAFGKLSAEDIDQLMRLLRAIFLPVSGMSSVADVLNRVAEKRAWTTGATDDSSAYTMVAEHKRRESQEWNAIMKALHRPFESMTSAMMGGLQHAGLALDLGNSSNEPELKTLHRKADSKHKDIEAEGENANPGDKKFGDYLEKQIEEFYQERKQGLTTWCEQKGITFGTSVFSDPLKYPSQPGMVDSDLQQHQSNQRQLYLVLYIWCLSICVNGLFSFNFLFKQYNEQGLMTFQMEFLLWSAARAVLDLVRFADRKVETGTMKKKRLILPGKRRIKKWIMNSLKVSDNSSDHSPDSAEVGTSNISVKESIQHKKDPEHLPPTNMWQRFGTRVAGIAHILASQESAFGFRVACATLSIGIVAFLEKTQTFFIQQRLVWAMIMVAIGMTITAGSGVFGFLGRIAGTVGYELEVATSNGQPAYPIYLLAPYRLACVSGGMGVAFVWTFFPYPLTARSKLRKDLGASLYLLASFYSCVHTTVAMRVRGEGGDPDDKNSLGNRLAKARMKTFTEELALLSGLRQHSAFTAWEPTFGGKFPKQQYDGIIQKVSNILNYMALISYSSLEFSRPHPNGETDLTWQQDFFRLMHTLSPTSEESTSLLSLLASSVTNGQPLPPYLKVPQPYRLTERLEALDRDILSVNHIAEPGYAAFAVMQIASSCMIDDIEKLISEVRELVGECGFQYQVTLNFKDIVDGMAHNLRKGGQDLFQ